jgi:hypothetical protein
MHLILARDLVGHDARRLIPFANHREFIARFFRSEPAARTETILKLNHHPQRTKRDIADVIASVLLNPDDRKSAEERMALLVAPSADERRKAIAHLDRCLRFPDFAFRADALILKHKILAHENDPSATQVAAELDKDFYDDDRWLAIKAGKLSAEEWLAYRTRPISPKPAPLK